MSAMRPVRLRGQAIGRAAVIWFSALVFSVLLFAELEMDRRASIQSLGSVTAFATVWGVRLAAHRSVPRLGCSPCWSGWSPSVRLVSS